MTVYLIRYDLTGYHITKGTTEKVKTTNNLTLERLLEQLEEYPLLGAKYYILNTKNQEEEKKITETLTI